MKTYLERILSGEPIIDEQIEQDVVAKRYYQPGEETRSAMAWRIARHVASAEDKWTLISDTIERDRWADIFYEAIHSQKLVPSSPIMFNAGTPTKMLSACTGVTFAEDSIPAIMKAVTECATLTADGAGVGYDITPLRYRDAPLSRKGVASGACSWLKLMDAVGQTVRQGGRNRRAAMLAALHIDHPDAVEFCFIKDNTTNLTHMNISLKVTDEFMRKVEAKEWHYFEFPVGSGNRVEMSIEPFDMDSKPDPRWQVFLDGYNAGQVDCKRIQTDKTGEVITKLYVRGVKADWLMNLITEHAHNTGEPGLLFIDRHDDQNPIHSVAPITTTNPCGEIGLNQLSEKQMGIVSIDGIEDSAHDSCNLAHLSLPRFVKKQDGGFVVDWIALGHYVAIGTRFLDNVIELSEYRPKKIGRANRAIRKTGLGVIGFADLLVMLGIKYGSEEALVLSRKLASFIEYRALNASTYLAEERGTFDLYKDSKYATDGVSFRAFTKAEYRDSMYSESQWDMLAERIRRVGLRNAMVTMLAPTGSTALIVGNLSNSIEPMFFKEQRRRTVDGVVIVSRHWLYEAFVSGELPDYVTEELFIEAHQVTPEQHVAMQNAWQLYVGMSISKTINLPHTAEVADVMTAYKQAWKGGAKGITVYRDGSRGYQPVSNAEVEMKKDGSLNLHYAENAPKDAPMKKVDANIPLEFMLGVDPKLLENHVIARPDVVEGRTHRAQFGFTKVYVTVNRDPKTRRVVEVFVNHGKAGTDITAMTEAIGRLISVALKHGTPIEQTVKQLREIGGEQMFFFKGRRFMSLPDAIGQLIEEDLATEKLGELAERQGPSVADILAEPDKEDITPLFAAAKCPSCGKRSYIKSNGCGSCTECSYTQCF